MVLFHIKHSTDQDEFLYETTLNSKNADVMEDIISIWNIRLRLRLLCGALEDLANYGPMKPPDQAGLDEIQEKYNGAVINKNEYYNPDPTGNRTGNGISPQLKDTFQKVIQNTISLISKDNIARKIPADLSLLKETLSTMGGAVTMAYPMGLPNYDTVYLLLNGKEDEGLEGQTSYLNPKSTELWIASKCLDVSPNAVLSQRFGQNEKTKLIAKLQTTGNGPPSREAAISEEEKKAMMAFYFKRQEELKALQEAQDDDYLSSQWADSKSLQKSYRGVSTIKAPGIR